MYEIGKITTTHGIRGYVKVINLSDFDRFKKDEKMYILLDEEKHFLKIEDVKEQARNLLVKFEGYNNINESFVLKGHTLFTDTKAELKANEFYYQDLYNLNVINIIDSKVIGKVIKVREMPTGPLLEVERLDDKKIALIPFVKEFIKDVKDDNIYVKPIEGLL